jgi:hypothetical protein
MHEKLLDFDSLRGGAILSKYMPKKKYVAWAKTKDIFT